MPDVDPAALGRTESTANGSATPLISSKPLPGAGAQKQKPPPAAPRVDLEPTYAALKSAVGEHWSTYQESFGQFILGYLSQAEFTRLTEHFICTDPNRQHLHNQLVCGIYANALRDLPDQPVAGWVSANDKPSIAPKPVSGDAAELRLKSEVMQLPPRVRQRLKGIQDEPYPRLTHDLLLQTHSKRITPISTSNTALASQTPATTTSTTGLNTELEIKKRYSQPLSTETRDLPSVSSLTDRLVPICYEEGLPSGSSSPESCIDLLSIGLETFIKEVVSNLLGRVSIDVPVSGPELAPSNTIIVATGTPVVAPAPPAQPFLAVTSTVGLGSARVAAGIVTSRYKQCLASETAAFARGEIKRSDTGLLPIEISAATSQNGVIGAAGDVRIAWDLSEPWLSALMPWLGEKVAVGEYPYTYVLENEDEDVDMLDLEMQIDGAGQRQVNGYVGGVGSASPSASRTQHKVNGVAMVNGDHDVVMNGTSDDADYGWQGSSAKDRMALSSLLDDCLAVGQ